MAANIVDAVAMVNSVSQAVSPQLDLMAEFYRDPPTTPLPIQADPEPRTPASFDDPADPTRAEDCRVSQLVELAASAVAGSVTQVAITAATSDSWRSLDSPRLASRLPRPQGRVGFQNSATGADLRF